MTHFDALIIGYGPVGATAAGLLAQHGWRVGVVDRLPDLYPLPRAICFDGEISRIFQELGIAKHVHARSASSLGAEFVKATGERIEGFDIPPDTLGPSGWPDLCFFHQPTLERQLRDCAEATGKVTTYLSYEASEMTQTPAGVSIVATPVEGGEALTLTANYLLAADGAASPTRKHLGFAFDSLGYDRDWLVVDVLMTGAADLPKITQQICDPARRVTFVAGVGERRRWEFQLNEGETWDEMLNEAKQWDLLRPWVTPDISKIERSAVYQFHAATANHWQDKRIFLLGDAVHQTPPFLGQGMCAGMRDAANLIWKLDFVERGLASSKILETYQEERLPHALDLVDYAAEMGRMIDTLAEAQVTGDWPETLDAVYGGSRGFPHLHSGVLALGADDDSDGITGFPAPQALVNTEQGPVLLDDIIGANFAIVSAAPLPELSAAHQALLSFIGAKQIILPEAERASPSMDILLAFHQAVIIRPDRYIFGLVNATTSLEQQLDRLSIHFQS
ncbi:MAG: bifunctional 3-(3-hydroxy-phenyl)propionate/3-hydroxycinnamic acid hydroxylase [Parvibaculaceae bacterium]|nr:bifunctional 3-(3-hydroxy-phenyl)propionate/3-hydroxycinnamic acid hydroxylase [Parvibaculaceae bacterium]